MSEANGVTSVSAGSASAASIKSPVLARLTSKQRKNIIGVAVVLILTMFVFPALLSTFWIKVLTQVAYYAVVAGGLGLLYGRVGLASLGQVALLGVGAWVTMRLSFLYHWPFPILMLIAGTVCAIFGLLIGLPALRLSGLYLALVTLMFGAAFSVVITTLKFPTGGPGFKGLVKDTTQRKIMTRPSMAIGESAYFRYVVVVCFLMFLLFVVHLVSKPGRAWASIGQSEAAALAAGVNTMVYKLWAFAMVSFATGVAGALLAADVNSPSPNIFSPDASLILMAVVIMAGYRSLWGALGAGLLARFMGEFLKDHGVSDRIGLMLFGLGVAFNLVISTRAMKKKGLIS